MGQGNMPFTDASAGGGGGRGGPGYGGGGGGGGDGSDGGSLRNLTAAFALAVMGGGGYAYKKRGSTDSLKASLSVGGTLLASSWLMGVSPTVGVGLALVTTSSLAVVMYRRYRASGKLMPAGVLTLVAAAYSIGYLRVLLG